MILELPYSIGEKKGCYCNDGFRIKPAEQESLSDRGQPFPPLLQTTSTTGFPRTSILGEIPSPGALDAAKRPYFRSGAPVAVDTVT